MAGMSGIVKTSLDTHILVTIWQGQPGAPALSDLLMELGMEGPMVVCAPVWVELCGLPGLRSPEVSRLLGELKIAVEFEIRKPVWELAATADGGFCDWRCTLGKSASGWLPLIRHSTWVGFQG